MDPMTMMILMGGASAALGAGGSILSGLQASKGSDSGDERLIFQRPGADPLQAGLNADALAGLGIPFLSTQMGASPIEQAIAEINEHPGLSTKQKRRAEAGLRSYMATGKLPRGSAGKEANRAAIITGLGGFKTLQGLRQEQQTFETREREFQREFAASQDTIRRARFGAAETLATSGTPEALAQQMQQIREVRDRNLVEQANRLGTSPVGAQTSSEEQLATLQQALSVLSGRQSLASGALTGSPSTQGAIQLLNSGRAAIGNSANGLSAARELGMRENENAAAGTAGASNSLADPFAMLAAMAFMDRNKSTLDSGELASKLGVQNNPGVFI